MRIRSKALVRLDMARSQPRINQLPHPDEQLLQSHLA
jgi:hypothetical protein